MHVSKSCEKYQRLKVCCKTVFFILFSVFAFQFFSRSVVSLCSKCSLVFFTSDSQAADVHMRGSTSFNLSQQNDYKLIKCKQFSLCFYLFTLMSTFLSYSFDFFSPRHSFVCPSLPFLFEIHAHSWTYIF